MRACCGGLDPLYDLTSAIMFSTNILYRLSGRRFPGPCVETRWPCHNPACGGGQDPAWLALNASGWHFGRTAHPSYPYRQGDGWANDWDISGLCGGRCYLPVVTMPSPILSIIEIVVDREVLDPSAYRQRGTRDIVRVDGNTWPCSNALNPPDPYDDPVFTLAVDATGGTYQVRVLLDGVTAGVVELGATDSAAAVESALEGLLGANTTVVSGGPGDAGATTPYLVTFDSRSLKALAVLDTVQNDTTGGASTVEVLTVDAGSVPPAHGWYVAYEGGLPVPPDGQVAASILACQVALARCGGEGCVLPARLKDISREEVSMTFADPLEFLEKGQVGIYEVDLWLQSVNPNKLSRRSAVYRADAPKGPGRYS